VSPPRDHTLDADRGTPAECGHARQTSEEEPWRHGSAAQVGRSSLYRKDETVYHNRLVSVRMGGTGLRCGVTLTYRARPNRVFGTTGAPQAEPPEGPSTKWSRHSGPPTAFGYLLVVLRVE